MCTVTDTELAHVLAALPADPRVVASGNGAAPRPLLNVLDRNVPGCRLFNDLALVDESVTSFQHTAVVTELGVADVFGHDERTQTRHLIEQAAHPQVREDLWEEAVALGLAAGG